MDVHIICAEKVKAPEEGTEFVHGECFTDKKIAELVRDNLQAKDSDHTYWITTLDLYDGPKRIG